MSGAQTSSFYPVNQLLVDNGQQIQNQYAPQRNELFVQRAQQEIGGTEIEMLARGSQSLLALGDEAKMAEQYPATVAELQRYGFAKNAPSVFPGRARLEQIAAMGTSSEKLGEQRGVASDYQTWLRSRGGGGTQGTVTPGAAPAVAPGGSATFAGGIAGFEGGGNAMPPENPRWPVARGGPAGAHQFIASTWNEFAKANPDLFKGMSPEQILAARSDATPVGPNGESRSTLATNWYAGENAKALTARNIEPTPANLGISHALGAGGAAKVLSAPDNTPLSQVIPETIAQNPQYGRMTVGDLKRQYSRLGPVGGAPAAPGTPPPYQLAGQPVGPPGTPPTAAVPVPGGQGLVTRPDGTVGTPNAGGLGTGAPPAAVVAPAQPPPAATPAAPVANIPPPPPRMANGLDAEQNRTIQQLEAIRPRNRAEFDQQQKLIATTEQTYRQHNETVDRQYRTDVQQAQQHAQTQANQAQQMQISQKHLDLAVDANRRANEDLAEKARLAGETFVPGTGIEAVHENTVQKYAAKVAKGQPLTDDEQRLYDGAYYALQQNGGQALTVTDPDRPGVMQGVVIPRRLPPSWPEPKGGRLPDIIRTPGATTKAPEQNAEQAKIGAYADAMQRSNPILNQTEDAALSWAQRAKAKAGDFVGFNINSPEYQKLRTAQEAFLTAVLRPESGAAIGQDEWNRYSKMYFPSPGEDAATVELKRQFRQAKIEETIRQAGPGYKPPAALSTTSTGAPAGTPPPPPGFKVIQ
jgi:hypothetical protein